MEKVQKGKVRLECVLPSRVRQRERVSERDREGERERESERDSDEERASEVRFGWQPESESGLLRCGSSGYPLASGHINDHSSHMALQSIWAKWPRSTL